MKQSPTSSSSADFIASLQPNLSASSASTSGESSDRAQLLQSLQVGGGAGVSGVYTMDDKVSGVSLLFLKSPNLLCGGLIGTSGCGCTVSAGTCDIEKHQKKKGVWPAEPALFLINKGKESAVYLEPYLPVALLPEDENATLVRLLKETFTVESWSEYVSNHEFAAQTGISIDKVSAELKSLKEAMKTPAINRKKRQVDFEASEAGFDLVTKKLSPSEPLAKIIVDKLKALHDLCADMKKDPAVSDTFPLIVEIAQRVQEIEELNSSEEERARAMSDFTKSGFSDFNTQIGAVNASITKLKAQIGTCENDDSILKGTIFEMLSQVEGFLYTSGVYESVRNHSPLVTQGLLSQVITPYRTSIEELGSRINILSQGHVGGFQGRGQSTFQLHTAPRVPAFSQEQAPEVAASTGPVRDLSWERDIEKKIKSLQDLANGTNTAGEGGVNFRGRSFHNRKEFKAWLTQLEGKSKFAIANFQCHVTLFHRIFTAMRGESRELRDAKAMSDMKIRDFDVNAVQALHISGVSLFFRGSTTSGPFTGVNTGGPKHRFSGMPTYQRYGDPSNPDGLLYRALETLEEILRTILSEIESDIASPEIRMLATTMLSRSEKFIRDLLSFMTDSYLEYMGSFGDTNTTWDFVCECVERILTTEFREAKSLATGMDFSEQDFSIKMIWCALNICTAQERFLEVGIPNHPVLSSTISRYLIKNTNAGNVEGIRTTVTSHTATIASLEAAITELRSQVRSATSLADKANAALKRYEKKEDKKKN